ncbi:MAG: D-amino acid dehydrogenase [Dechloromonas sp.]|uniref:D-amino acid dehydrogenase n=1 Tax=Candidatus Dechloromonas phosphorivorans TaxID=2899244 RepID=A0A9D7QMJ8_9RHOO|nr:D-amino acid dehydrogenase [Candidatus Dechloromonas phosphorivorans]
MKVLVLGAGVVGTTSAWYLARASHEVVVVDRQPVAGNETSFANGGQISVSHAEPWANPHVLPQVIKWLGHEDAPLLWRWRADPAQFMWGLRFLNECRPAHTRRNIAAIVALALYSRGCLQTLRHELGVEYDHLERGILHLYTDPRAFAGAIEAARTMREFGLDRETVSAERCVEIEPALAGARHRLAGGTYTPTDESGDAYKFTGALAERAAALGVEFRFNSTVDRISISGGRIAGVIVSGPAGNQLLNADAYVVALGSYTPLLLRPLGVRLPVIPAKGYSATVPLSDAAVAPTVSLTDDEHRLVFSRLGNRLRIAGTAEFNGYNLDLNPVRCNALLRRARQLFPALEAGGEPQFWCGLRPSTPSNVPCIGRTRYPGLWLNTGHGTLGWTMACGSAAALADLMSGRRPAPDFPFLGC